jgi:hypothetical protein
MDPEACTWEGPLRSEQRQRLLIIAGPCTEGPSAANCFTEGFDPARTALANKGKAAFAA